MKLVVSVSKTHTNRGSHRHRPSTKKYWHIYYYDEEGKFCTQRVSFIEALFYKLNKARRLKFFCQNCENVFTFIVPRGRKLRCPNCEQEAGENE